MDATNISKSEAEFAGFVDRGTQAVLQDAVKQIVEAFSQNDALEDMLSYLEEMREILQNSDDRLRDIQQRDKKINERMGATETSVSNLLQRIQSMEVQVAQTAEKIDAFTQRFESRLESIKHLEKNMALLVEFFSKPPFARMFGKLAVQEDAESEWADTEE